MPPTPPSAGTESGAIMPPTPPSTGTEQSTAVESNMPPTPPSTETAQDKNSGGAPKKQRRKTKKNIRNRLNKSSRFGRAF